jgi:predicted nucleotidyltransferase
MMMIQNKLFGLPNAAIVKIRAVFAKYDEVKRVILYGSRATGNYRLGSDIDLCIEGETLNLTQLLKIANQVDELLLPWKIELSLKHEIDNQALLDHIRDNGIIFYSSFRK